MNPLDILPGKKTQLTGAGMIIYGVGGLLAGMHDPNTAVQLALEGFAMIFMRQAIKNGTGA